MNNIHNQLFENKLINEKQHELLEAIHSKKMKNSIFGLTVEQQSKFILIKGLIVTVIIFYGLTNGFTGVEIPEAYQVIIGK